MEAIATPLAPAALRIRQSDLRALEEQCPAMAYATNVERRPGPSFAGSVRGTAVHEVFSRYTTHLFKTGRQTDFEAAERIAREVIRAYPALDFTARVDVREQARNIAEGFIFDAFAYYGSEEDLATDLVLEDGRLVRITGRLDLLEVFSGEGRAKITDAKSNHLIPPDSAVKDDFQLRTYALLVLDNLPHVDEVEGTLWMTRYNRRCPQKDQAVWTRADLEDFREHLRVRLAAHFDGKLRSVFVPGTWCQYCPRRRPGDCARWRSYASTTPPPLGTFFQARRVAARVIALEQERELLIGRLKEYVNEHGPVTVGDTARAETFGFHATESEDFDAGEFLEVLRDPELVSLAGEQPVGQLFSVNKRSRTFRQIRHNRDLKHLFDDIATTKVSTRFAHKGVGDE